MGILDDDVARVREATDLVALAGEHIDLKRVGRRFMGLCPFHTEKTPSFSINPELGVFHCFGCQRSGDAITFIREVEHLDFVEAVERLAARAGITLRYDNAAVGKDRKRKERLSEVVEAGLAFVNRANKLQDQFRSRLMFPIYDSRGEPAGFGGRALGDQMPKYKNSPDTPVYQKSRLLYGLNWAKGEIVARGEVVICEGYTDVMAFVLAGSPNAVATCGTALADEHFQILKNLARKVVLAYDADSAGQAAAARWYQWEQAYEVEVEVADLPAGRDPGDLWKDDRGALTTAIERAAPFLQFRIDRLLAGADLRTLESKARTAEDAAAIIASHPSELVRDQYVMKLAGMLDIDADQLRTAVRAGPRRRPARESRRGGDTDATPPPRPTQVDRRELDVLRWAIHSPELVADWLDSSLFIDPAARSVFALLAESATFQEALDSSDDSTRALLQRLANEEPPEVENEDEAATLRARLMANTVEPAAQRLLVRMLHDGDERGSEVKMHLSAMTHHREIGDWEAARHDAEQLVGWAVARADANEGRGSST